MSNIKELKELLEKDILIEVNQEIKEIEEKLSLKKNNKQLKEELNYIKQVKLYFDEVIIDINSNILTEEQALDILEGLEDMRVENQDF